ncbi:hypothetical protein IMCC14465_11040 [alpha proteobacterium IMCC14465]|uniref:HTH gntR-type domain-containing protein n=1 Tax=alpha proteobacterium IMCC14465 TaxID=1220535 RepID=J9DGQ2_9PROT|nr:hypothetical protein IMCC14465_11040 [alpha proteobacterium IMCC14465]
MPKAADKAYYIIREAILNGELKEAEKIVEEDLVDLCQVSRTPVRDALKKLNYEGFIILKENQGGWVRQWSKEEVREVFEARALVEGYIIQLTADKVQEDDIIFLADNVSHLEEIIAAHISANENVDTILPLFLENNRAFHDKLYEICRNDRLRNLMFALSPPPLVHRTAKVFDFKRIQQSCHDHNMIVTALKSGDRKWAKSVMQAHILAAADSYAEHFNDF